jgi:predicted aspartyl protease
MLRVSKCALASVLSVVIATEGAWAETQVPSEKQDVQQAAQQAAQQANEHSAHLDISHGKPFAMVSINGQGPFRFVIDTGTGAEAIITSQLAEKLAIPHSGRLRLTDPSGKGSQIMPTVVIDSLQVAGVEFTGVKAAVHSLSDTEGACQGLLGFKLFRDYLLTLDYPDRRMSLSSGELVPDNEQLVLPFRMPDDIPIVSLAIGTKRIDTLIDSGGTGLSLPEGFAAQLQFLSDPVVFSNSHSLSTRFQVKSAKLAADVHLGAYTFERPFVELNPAFPLANFGGCTMKDFSLTFDQKHLLIRFAGSRPVIHLSPAPAPVKLTNAKRDEPADLTLVPVG